MNDTSIFPNMSVSLHLLIFKLVIFIKFFFFLHILAMPELLRSAKLAVEKGLAQGQDESYVKWLSDYIIPALVEALHKVIFLFFLFSPLYLLSVFHMKQVFLSFLGTLKWSLICTSGL